MSTEDSHEGTPENLSSDHPTTAGDGAPKRRRSSLVAVSVAAAVLVAGGGGAYWASTASDGDGGTAASGKNDPPPLTLDGYGARAAKGEGGKSGIAPGEPNPGGGTVYQADGPLPAGPDSAAVYRPAAEVGKAEVMELATALQARGAPRLVDGSWKLGLTRDASGPTLTVSSKAPGTWMFSRYGKGGGCSEPSMNRPPKGTDADTVPPSRCPAPGDLPSAPSDDSVKPVSEAKAKEAVAPVLKAIGLSTAKLDASRAVGALRTVNVNPTVEGRPTYAWMTGLVVGADGQIVTGSGKLAALEKGAEYPVSSAKATLARLNEAGGGGRVSIGGGCASAKPYDKGASDNLPCTPAPPDSKPAKVRSAAFGLAAGFSDGHETLVPSWLFEVEQPGATGPDNTFTVTYPAVDPRYIAKPEPGDAPTGRPAEPDAEKSVTSYGADGRELTVHFWGGVCKDYSVNADQSGASVKVKITGADRKSGQNCVMIAKKLDKKVTLDKPLGDRKVVDAVTGKAVPKS